MTARIRFVIVLAAWTAASCGLAGAAFADPLGFYQIRLRSTDVIEEGSTKAENQKVRLTKFVERLRAELMVGNLGEANIGCDRCGELVEAEKVEGLPSPGGTPIYLEFTLLRNGSQLEAFARSYEFVQASEELNDTSFTMEIDGTKPGASACTTAQISLGCRTRASCVQTGGCDKVYGGACNLCPTG